MKFGIEAVIGIELGLGLFLKRLHVWLNSLKRYFVSGKFEVMF